MSDIAIRIVGLGKQYHIGARRERYKTLRQTVTESLTAPVKRVRRLMSGETLSSGDHTETIWALKDVSFDVRHGDVMGIIGRNGAGKSTLLKILSRITEPSEGYADVYGRVGALLEVGTGFHPELTGRENIYLNGAILGMTRAEIDRKFDEIVHFAEIEKFIDTPVKHYSSGMGLRLGFAVAAHLEPEILVVDEVLAVGDAAFQNKCIGKMGQVAGEGRTVLFVSHNIAAVASLCNRCVMLQNGRLHMIGETNEVIEEYQASIDSAVNIPLAQREDRTGNGLLRFTNLHFTGIDSSGRLTDMICGAPARISVEVTTANGKPVRNPAISIKVLDLYGHILFTCSTRFSKRTLSEIASQSRLEVDIPSLPLVPGIYRVELLAYAGGQEADHIKEAGQFIVTEGDFFGTGRLPEHRKHGPILVPQEWKINDVETP